MSGVNKVILVGRVGKDPEIKTLTSGNMVANFSLATSETFKDKNTGEKKETTEWHNLVLWGKTAELAGKYVHKGDQLYVEGKITTRSWEKDGIKRYTTEIVVNAMQFLGSKNASGGEAAKSNMDYWEEQDKQRASSGAAPKNTTPEMGATDDLPF